MGGEHTALVSLAAEISREHEAICQTAASALAHARRAGELLIDAKAAVPHGTWLPWLTEHCPTLPERTAQAYMQIARRWPELEAAKPQRVADLPVRQALALFTEPSEELTEHDRVINRVLDQHRKLTGLIRHLVWVRSAMSSIGRRRTVARFLDSVVKDFDRIGWGDEARALVEYCEAMPAFGRDAGIALRHELVDMEIAILEEAGA